MAADDLVKTFMPLAERMQREGRSQVEIERCFSNYLGLKAKNNVRVLPMKYNSNVLSVIQRLKERASDEPAPERMLYDLLIDSKIKFSFQASIGRYQVTFLIQSLVVEVDGNDDPDRDAFLTARGYQIIKFPVNMLISTPRAVIQAIQEVMDQ